MTRIWLGSLLLMVGLPVWGGTTLLQADFEQGDLKSPLVLEPIQGTAVM